MTAVSSRRAGTLAHAQRPQSLDSRRTLHQHLLQSVERTDEARVGELEGQMELLGFTQSFLKAH